MEPFSTGAALRFGWETFKKRPWFLAGTIFLAYAVSWSVSSALQSPRIGGITAFVLFLVSVAIGTLIAMGLTAFTLHAHDDMSKVSMEDLWHPQSFWNYLGASILTGLIVLVGLVLLIVPGIIFTLMFAFVKYLVIDRDLNPVAAMKESERITHGHRLELLLFFLALVGFNILGLLALAVGLLVTVPVSMLAIAHAYRTLAHAASEMTANAPDTASM